MQFASLLSQLDSRPSVRGRQFERLCVWYLRNAPEYRHRIRSVWLWADWSGAWGVDAGIDLVAEDSDGRLWAIQAKAYAESYAIKKADVDSFLSESSRPQFSFRLLIATTDHLGPTARRTLEAQREPVGYLLRSQLELAEVIWPSSLSDLRPRRPRPKTPFPHVSEAIHATVKGLAAEQRGQLIMACGTGKTLAAMWIAERLQSARTLVLVPSLSLLAQTLREWSANASGPFEYLAVCSDPTVVGEDALVERTAELAFPTTTEESAIAAFLRRRGRRVVFSTYQSSGQIAAAFEGRTPHFDLAIADEAHRCAGRTSSEFATILDASKIRSKRRLFMTATPRFFTSRARREAGEFDVDIASMDDEVVFGPVLHRLTFGEAIGRDLLSDYQVVVVGVEDETYRAWAERGEFVTIDGKKVTGAGSLAAQVGLAKSMRKYDLRRVITFHGRVKAAREFSAEMPRVVSWMPPSARPSGAIWSEHVSGQMTSGHRDRLLLRFRNISSDERALLSNARCLAEGVDVPSIDGVAFVDPRRSTIEIVQALGRAIRKSAEKRVGTVVLPVFLSAGDEPEQILDESAFEHVWDVLKALRAHDEVLGEELDRLRRRMGARRGVPRRPGKIKLDVSRRVGADFARAFDIRLVERTTSSWEFYFGLLQLYVEREGHALVPSAALENGYRLGGWVNNQRAIRARGDLDPDRERQLEQVPGWAWDTLDTAWEEGFAHLQLFVEREGHARVPQGARESGYRLGSWVTNQRSRRAHGELEPARKRRLEELPGWSWDPRQTRWEEGFAHLQRFVEREGHAQVPQSAKENSYSLGRWTVAQRQAYRQRTLEAARVRRLEALPGWAWDPRDATWEHGFACLQRYVERERHSRVPFGAKEDSFPLGSWVNWQRRTYRDGTLGAARGRRLEALPGWTWNTFDATWEEGLARLQRYVEREGDSRVPQGAKQDGFPLGSWVTKQRANYRQGRLDKDRARRLEALSGWSWTPSDDDWERGFSHLQRYVQREGDSRVPQSFREPDGFGLGAWVANQRRRDRQGNLEAGRRSRLEGLPGWTSKLLDDDAWEEGFTRLQGYVKREGHSRVPLGTQERGYRLGQWVAVQRQFYGAGRIDPERRARLEALPGWTWEPRQTRWEEGFSRLQEYVKREGNSRVPEGTRESGFRLDSWVSNQRANYRRGTLNTERANRLAGVPGWTWAPYDDDWEVGFANLQSFVEREGHARVSRAHLENGYRLSQWVDVQRHAYREGKIDPQRRSRLEALPNWVWDTRRQRGRT